MNHQDSDKQMIDQVKRSLDQQADELDAATLSKLRQARARALDEMGHKTSRLKSGALWTGGLATAGACAVALMLVWPEDPEITTEFGPAIADAEMLSDENSIEFYQELDFYIWLDQQELNGSEA